MTRMGHFTVVIRVIGEIRGFFPSDLPKLTIRATRHETDG